jgi:TetR/AcrR family transcriptional regulator, transcriptional repressor for nem operon
MREREKLGRPRQFDKREMLAKIMDVFWSKGFEGTSLKDLVVATGLKKGSLYAAYGDKRAMYLQALRLYDEIFIEMSVSILRGSDAPAARIDRFLRASIEGEEADGIRRGCFLCNASIDQAAVDAESQSAVAHGFERLEGAISDVVSALDGQFTGVKNQNGRVGQVLATYLGLRVLARAGRSRTHLADTLDAALHSILRFR